MLHAFLDGLYVLIDTWALVLCAAGGIGAACAVLFLPISQDKMRSWLLPGFFFVFSLPLRLAFLKDIYVPPYFDSVEHYRIVKELVTAWEASTFPAALTPDYYHLGFHFIASLLTIGLHAVPMDVILVLGQVLLAALPIPVFFIVREETSSDAAALFAMLLAGFGWYMPGFTVNWGKYPALAGLFALEILLGILYLNTKHFRRRGRRLEQMFLICLLILGILISALFHTRTIIVIVISIVSWFIGGKVQTWLIPLRGRPLSKQFLLPGSILIGLVAFGVFAKREPLLNLVLEPYLGAGLWVTIMVLALGLIALIRFPQGAYSSLIFISLLFAALFTPAPAWMPVLTNQTLLDRPFVEMLLYLPLSILGGLGLAGGLTFPFREYYAPLDVILRNRGAATKDLFSFATWIILAIIGLVLLSRYDYYPSDCCQLVGYDDTVALDWIDSNLPQDARILAAGTQLNVLPSGPSAGLVGTDAGAWIPALTGRGITLAPFETDFRSESIWRQLCQEQVSYIYVGSTRQRFNAVQLQAKENWYNSILFLPNVQLYQLTGCGR